MRGGDNENNLLAELRDLVRGVVWRDQHFNCLTIRQIAEREGHSEVFVGRLIHKTFEIA